jgi:N-succinyldiaminopimelate aminotransferase
LPKFPEFSDKTANLKNAVFERFRSQMSSFGSDMIRLHIGDTYQQPVYQLPLSREYIESEQGFNRYCNTFGLSNLRTALSKKLAEDNDINVNIDNIMLTAGATNALSAALHTILNKQDEILVLTPCWPIFRGLVHSVPANVVEIPFYECLAGGSEPDVSNYLGTYLSENTAAIYINSPNNPSGKILSLDLLQQVGQFAREYDLWILTDKAYDGLAYDGHSDNCLASYTEFSDQTISVFTFSKLYMFAGMRLGYAVAGKDVIRQMNKTMVHQLYSPSTMAQQLMIRPVQTRRQWQNKVRERYQILRDLFFDSIGIIPKKPEAGYFMFFSISKYLGTRSYDQIINDCLANGVSVAPGEDFGRGFEDYIRICFTGEPEEKLVRGAQILKTILLDK